MGKYQQASWLSPATVRGILESLANMREPGPMLSQELPQFHLRVRELARRFPTVFEELQPLLTDQGAVTGISAKAPDDSFVMAVIGLSRHVREVWKASRNRREAEWMIFELRQLYQRIAYKARVVPVVAELKRIADSGSLAPNEAASKAVAQMVQGLTFWGWWPNPVPPLTTFEQLMCRFQRMLPQARLCANSECQNPYFFANTRRKCCSGKCENIRRKQYKLDWWNTKGRKRREQKRRLEKKSKGPKL